MRKLFLGIVIAFSLYCTPAFSNECLDNINDHVYGNGTQLDLGSCHITDSDMTTVALALSKLPDLTDLFLDNNQIGPEGIAQLAGNHTISLLELHDNHLGQKGAAIVASFSKLKVLCLSNNNIGDEGAVAIANSPTIEQLFVNENNITAIGVKAIIQNSAVWNLALSRNNLDKTALAILSSSKKLRWLSIEENDISPEGAELLVANMSSLESLDICKNPIGNNGMRAIAKKNTLRELYAMNCAIGPEGAIVFAKADMANLYHIILDGNYIGDKGAAALAKTTSRKFLFSLEENEISNEGAKMLAESSLISNLFLSRNDIQDEGAMALAKSTTLQFLDVRYNRIGEKGIESLKNSSIYMIATGGNYDGEYSKGLKTELKHPHPISRHHIDRQIPQN